MSEKRFLQEIWDWYVFGILRYVDRHVPRQVMTEGGDLEQGHKFSLCFDLGHSLGRSWAQGP